MENLSPLFADCIEQERRELIVTKKKHLLYFKYPKQKPEAKPNNLNLQFMLISVLIPGVPFSAT